MNQVHPSSAILWSTVKEEKLTSTAMLNKQITEGYTLYDATYVRYPDLIHVWRLKTEAWPPVAERRWGMTSEGQETTGFLHEMIQFSEPDIVIAVAQLCGYT